MLGFGALGQLALGELPRVPVAPVPGSGAAYWRFGHHFPEPAFEARPNKPFRPVWDRGRVEAIAVTRPAPTPVPLPPPSIFQAPPLAPTGSGAPFGLPDFADVAPPDPAGLGHRMLESQRDTTDTRDALDAIAGLILLSKGPSSVN